MIMLEKVVTAQWMSYKTCNLWTKILITKDFCCSGRLLTTDVSAAEGRNFAAGRTGNNFDPNFFFSSKVELDYLFSELKRI